MPATLTGGWVLDDRQVDYYGPTVKGRTDQPRVPAGSPEGGQFGTSGSRSELRVGPGVLPAHVDEVRSAIDALPAEFLAHVGSPSIVIEKVVIHPRDGRPSSSYAGLMYRPNNTLHIATTASAGFRLPPIGETVAHELGHAFQAETKSSILDAFLSDVRAQDAERDITSERFHARDWFPHYRLNEREAFAQSVATLFGYGGDLNRAFRIAFPGSVSAARAALVAHGVKV